MTSWKCRGPNHRQTLRVRSDSSSVGCRRRWLVRRGRGCLDGAGKRASRAHRRAATSRAPTLRARPPRFAARRVARSPSSARAVFPSRVRNARGPRRVSRPPPPPHPSRRARAKRVAPTPTRDAPSAREMSACSRASLGAPRASSRAPSRAPRRARPAAPRAPLPRRAVSGDNASGVGASDARLTSADLPDDFSDADPGAPGAPRPVSVLRPAPPPTGVPAPPHRRRPGSSPSPAASSKSSTNVTRTSGVRLGVVTQLWVDVDDWEVVALDVRPGNSPLDAIGGAVDHVLMSSLRQVGDVVLVHDESAVERRWSSYGLSTVVGCDVVTERGVYIGRVRDYEFDPEDGLVQRLVVDALGLPVVPEGVQNRTPWTCRLSAGLDRVIVADGAESRVEQLTASLLQRLQLTAPPWEEDLATYADYYEQDERRREMDARARFEAAGRRGTPTRRSGRFATITKANAAAVKARATITNASANPRERRESRWCVRTVRTSGGTRTGGTETRRARIRGSRIGPNRIRGGRSTSTSTSTRRWTPDPAARTGTRARAVVEGEGRCLRRRRRRRRRGDARRRPRRESIRIKDAAAAAARGRMTSRRGGTKRAAAGGDSTRRRICSEDI